jgi:pimeloyl-ACP methyl ester carboxylesterase
MKRRTTASSSFPIDAGRSPIDAGRRRVLLGGAGAALLAAGGCASTPAAPGFDTMPPVIFVHGNGDSAALWLTTLWYFEANGWPADRLRALNFPYPVARDEDDREQAGRSSATDQMLMLSVGVEGLMRTTGAPKVALVGNSRGGLTIRNFIESGGHPVVSHAVLGGTPNHGIWNDPSWRIGSEFNGAGAFLKRLNEPRGFDQREVHPDVKWMTLRSDKFDKYAQPDGRWIGQPGAPTNVGYDSPELRGAKNVVLPGRDHREVSFHREAFAHTFEFISGRKPATLELAPQKDVTLNGVVTGMGIRGQGNFPNNLPQAGVLVEVYEVDPASGARRGSGPVHSKRTDEGGEWGPFKARSDAYYEFVLATTEYAVTHIYRSPFPRSSNIVHMRLERLTAQADREAEAVVLMTRPRGYLGVGRDKMSFDGKSPPPNLNDDGMPGISQSRIRYAQLEARPIVAELNGERIAGRAWPAKQGHITLLEFHY